MCLLLAAWRVHPDFDLVVAANRDERHARPALPLHPWSGEAGIHAGIDLEAGGTWLGVDGRGRFAAVTNFHEGRPAAAGQPSRGRLVSAWLRDTRSPEQFLRELEPEAGAYAGFNLLLADADGLWYASNRASPFARALRPGLHGLSNHLLDTPWPKVQRAGARLAGWVDRGERDEAALRALLADTGSDDAAGGLTGPAASAAFIQGQDYGTRCSTWLTRGPGHLRIAEARFAPAGRPLGTTQFALAPAA